MVLSSLLLSDRPKEIAGDTNQITIHWQNTDTDHMQSAVRNTNQTILETRQRLQNKIAY